ncbi:MAG: hypothetical protein ACRBCS_05900 [Cellvibrionaceae bacterium]
MDKTELSDVGFNLAKELSKLGETFHVKADARDILLYESATVEQEAKDLAENTGVKEHLKESTLLGQWGQSIHHQLPDRSIIDRVKVFHDCYQQVKNT